MATGTKVSAPSAPIPHDGRRDLCDKSEATPSALLQKREYVKRVAEDTVCFTKSHQLRRVRDAKIVPLIAVTRSHYLPEGRANSAAVYWARVHRLLQNENVISSTELPKFVTLTIASAEVPGCDQRAACNRVMTRLRVWAKRAGNRIEYCRVAETQARGVVHYHYVIFNLPYVHNFSAIVLNTWQLGFGQIKAMRGGTEQVMAYISKYLSKYMYANCDKRAALPADVLTLRIYNVRKFQFSRGARFPKSEGTKETWVLELIDVWSSQLEETIITQTENTDRDKVWRGQQNSIRISPSSSIFDVIRVT